MNKTLDKFLIGEEGVVIKVDGEGKVRRRIFDMGVTPGAHIVMTKLAPLGDPLQIEVRGYSLTLRKNEAILVEMNVTKEVLDEKKAKGE